MERNREAGQNPPRVVAPIEEEEEEEEEEDMDVFRTDDFLFYPFSNSTISLLHLFLYRLFNDCYSKSDYTVQKTG